MSTWTTLADSATRECLWIEEEISQSVPRVAYREGYDETASILAVDYKFATSASSPSLNHVAFRTAVSMTM
jgi:hypothetical protein